MIWVTDDEELAFRLSNRANRSYHARSGRVRIAEPRLIERRGRLLPIPERFVVTILGLCIGKERRLLEEFGLPVWDYEE